MLAEPRTGGVAAAGGWGHRSVQKLSACGPEVWLVLAITAVAALVRFATITTQSFWVDEATTVHEVGLSFGQMLHELRGNETTPPLYFALAWIWTRIFGAGELGIRSLSAICGVALVPVAYLCGRELVSKAAGVVAAAFVAVGPLMIWYSQEARSYMLFALLGALSLLFAARFERTRARRDLWLWAVSSALAVLTHFFAGFLVAPEALWLLWRVRDRGLVVACAVVAAVQVAILPLAIGDTSHPLSWIQGVGGLSSRIDAIANAFAASELYKTQGAPGTGALVGAGLLALVAAGLLRWGADRRARRGAALAAGLGLMVVLVPIVLAWLGRDYVFNRNFIVAWVPLAIALAAACTAPRARVAGAVLALVLVAGFVWAGVKVAGDPQVQRQDWRAAAAALGRPLGPRAIYASDGNFAEQPLAIYLPRTRFSYLGQPLPAPAVTVAELDVVGNPYMTADRGLPAGVRLLSAQVVSVNIKVWRFGLVPSWHLPTTAIAARAQAIFGQSSTPSVLIQR